LAGPFLVGLIYHFSFQAFRVALIPVVINFHALTRTTKHETKVFIEMS